MSARRSKRVKAEEEDVVKVEAEVEKEEKGEEEDEHPHLQNYEQIRQENIQRNQQFLNSIGIQDVKSDFISSANTSSAKKPSSRGLSTGTKRKVSSFSRSSAPPRRSGRVTIERLRKEIDDTVASGNDADVTLLDQKRNDLEIMMAEKAATTYDASASNNYSEDYTETRHTSEDIALLTPLNQPKHADDTTSSDWGHGLLPLLRGTGGGAGAGDPPTSSSRRRNDPDDLCQPISTADAQHYRSCMASLQVAETDVAKVVPQRITSLVIHPSPDRTLVIAGDKQGHIGFWNADEGNDVVGGKAQVGGEDGVYLYRPHAQSISSLYIPPHTPEQVWSTSYDGTVRRMDLEREAFVEVYRASGEFEDVSFHDAAFSGSGVAYLGCRTGEVMALDGRSGEVSWSAQAHDGKVNSVQIHPQHEHILISASTGMKGFIAAHDLRKVSSGSSSGSAWKPLFTLDEHAKSINAAYLSPGTGEHLVSVSLDNTVKVWKDIMTHSGKQPAVFTSFGHDNHTGRWLSTLKPTFDPHTDSSAFTSFLLGSMAKPRRVELYTLPSSSSSSSSSRPTVDTVVSLSGDHVGSVCSRNCFHPSRRNVIAGGNSSGKVHLFR